MQLALAPTRPNISASALPDDCKIEISKHFLKIYDLMQRFGKIDKSFHVVAKKAFVNWTAEICITRLSKCAFLSLREVLLLSLVIESINGQQNSQRIRKRKPSSLQLASQSGKDADKQAERIPGSKWGRIEKMTHLRKLTFKQQTMTKKDSKHINNLKTKRPDLVVKKSINQLSNT